MDIVLKELKISKKNKTSHALKDIWRKIDAAGIQSDNIVYRYTKIYFDKYFQFPEEEVEPYSSTNKIKFFVRNVFNCFGPLHSL